MRDPIEAATYRELSQAEVDLYIRHSHTLRSEMAHTLGHWLYRRIKAGVARLGATVTGPAHARQRLPEPLPHVD